MALRRMISNLITNTAPFLRMPATAQMLYMHLTVNADDEGVAEGFEIIRKSGTSEDDLFLLGEKGFITILDRENLVVLINEWEEFNAIRKDQFKESRYHDLIESQKVNSTTGCQSKDGQPVTGCQSKDGQPVALGKVSIGKVSIGKDSINTTATTTCSNNNILAPVDKSVNKTVDNLQSQQSPFSKHMSDEKFGEVAKLYQDNVHLICNQVEADDLASFYDEYGYEWIVMAIKEAARANAKSIRYIKGILGNWSTRGYSDPWNHPDNKPKPGGKGRNKQTHSQKVADMAEEAMEMMEATTGS